MPAARAPRFGLFRSRLSTFLLYVRQRQNVNILGDGPDGYNPAEVDRRITVFLAEDNLMFSARLRSVLEAAGFAVEVSDGGLPDSVCCDVMVLSLGCHSFDAQVAADKAREAGAKLIGHAGGRETEMIALGKRIGCDRILSNSQAMTDIVSAVKDLCGS